jgi:hypothetical protein
VVRVDEILYSLEQQISSSTTESDLAPTRGVQLALNLGPIELADPPVRPGVKTLEKALLIGQRLSIPEKFVRRWHARQTALGWKDSYGNPIRSLGNWLTYCWRLEPKTQTKPTTKILSVPPKAEHIRREAKKLLADFREKQQNA